MHWTTRVLSLVVFILIGFIFFSEANSDQLPRPYSAGGATGVYKDIFPIPAETSEKIENLQKQYEQCQHNLADIEADISYLENKKFVLGKNSSITKARIVKKLEALAAERDKHIAKMFEIKFALENPQKYNRDMIYVW